MTKKEKRAKAISERTAAIPLSLRKTYTRAVKRVSFTSAIKAMCQMCMGWDIGFRKDIRHCTDLACPLYLYRPYRRRVKKAISETEA